MSPQSRSLPPRTPCVSRLEQQIEEKVACRLQVAAGRGSLLGRSFYSKPVESRARLTETVTGISAMGKSIRAYLA